MLTLDFVAAIALIPIAVADAEIASATEDCRNLRRVGFMMHLRVLLAVYFIMTVSECHGQYSRRYSRRKPGIQQLANKADVHRN